LWPDRPARDALATLASNVARETEGRAPRTANFHLTVAFVGEVVARRVAELHVVGKTAAGSTPPFLLTLDRVGGFRGSGIAWAGASVLPTALQRLAQQLADGLAAGDFVIERRAFQAHVTLARRCRRPAKLTLEAPIEWDVTRLALVVSDLSTGAPHYRELASWPLAGPIDKPGDAD
jgi:2'-5' RNA ligase